MTIYHHSGYIITITDLTIIPVIGGYRAQALVERAPSWSCFLPASPAGITRCESWRTCTLNRHRKRWRLRPTPAGDCELTTW